MTMCNYYNINDIYNQSIRDDLNDEIESADFIESLLPRALKARGI